MLKSLHIKNFILIDHLELEFKKGFTVITGETGAGKSIILDALQVVLGDRANTKLLKDNEKPASVLAIFNIKQSQKLVNLLNEKSINSEDDQLILRRTIQPDNTNKCFINDYPVGVKLLQEVAQHIFEISNQHESTQLLDTKFHLQLLDEFGNYSELLKKLGETFYLLVAQQTEHEQLKQKREKAEFEIQYLHNTIEELESLDIQDKEEDSLIEQRKMSLESSKIKEAIEATTALFERENILTQLYSAQKELNSYESIFNPLLNSLNSAIIELEEVHKTIFTYQAKFSEPMKLDEIEDRLFKIRSICKKHLVSSSELNSLLKLKKQELNTYEDLDQLLTRSEKQLSELKNNYLKQATILSEKRKLAASHLTKLILGNLNDLKMEKAEFVIEVTSSQNIEEFKPSGIDKVRFLIKTNEGRSFDLIHKVASGGELSRTMLALKISLSKNNLIPTIVFDEIDSGISGAVADAVGRKLAELGQNYQVIVISHQPQVAALSSNHIVIEKLDTDKTISVKALELNAKQKQEEIARMISGQNITEESLAAAHKLIQAAA